MSGVNTKTNPMMSLFTLFYYWLPGNNSPTCLPYQKPQRDLSRNNPMLAIQKCKGKNNVEERVNKRKHRCIMEINYYYLIVLYTCLTQNLFYFVDCLKGENR